MLSIDDVLVDVNMHDLCVFESALAHEKKNKGVEAFCKRYEEAIEDFREVLPHIEFCFLLAYLEYHDHSFHYDDSVRLEKVVLDAYDMLCIQMDDYDDLDWSEVDSFALSEFKKRGFYNQTLSEAVGYGTSN